MYILVTLTDTTAEAPNVKVLHILGVNNADEAANLDIRVGRMTKDKRFMITEISLKRHNEVHSQVAEDKIMGQDEFFRMF